MSVYPYTLASGKTLWFYLIDLPPTPDGKRRRKKKRGFASQPAALKAERDALAAYSSADLTADGSVAAELDKWLGERELDLEETTLANYGDLFRCYINPHIGTMQIYSLDKHVLHDLYKKLLKKGNKRGGPLSQTTVRTVHKVLIKALADIGIIVEGVRKPRPAQREGMGRKGVWTPAQSKKFLQYHKDSRLRAAWVLAIIGGLRRGELAGLKWPKIDLDGGVLHVHWQRTTSSNKVIEKEPKGKSKRSLAIGPMVVAELRAHEDRQTVEKADFGVAYRDGQYVFCHEDGKPFYPDYLTEQWEKACKEADVPVIALHDARHTSSTAGADSGVPEHVMQKRLGHADARTTREVYTHVLPESERKAAEIMEAMLGDAASWTA